MYHLRKTFKKYKALSQTSECPFCDVSEQEAIIFQTKHAFILPNKVRYDLWDGLTVAEHLMVIPKRHVTSMAELTKAEAAEIMAVMQKYEADGYNVYARAVGSIMRSVEHQHTHLIKTSSTRRARFLLFIRRPYYLKKL